MIEYRKRITRQMLRDEPEKLFVFGDNLERRGLGGQAREMRGEPNAVGIPTKRSPSMVDGSFFTNDDFYVVRTEIDPAMAKLAAHLLAGGTVVWPADGIGTGLADLPRRAPWIWTYLEHHRADLDWISETGKPPRLLPDYRRKEP